MFCGTPVVGFRTGGIPEMIEHKVNGYLAACKSAEELAQGMKWVLTSESYEQLSAKTRQLALERFSRERSVEMHLDLYKQVLNEEAQS
jgi:glycosyltransferase involved in cell wall biosynthesis